MLLIISSPIDAIEHITIISFFIPSPIMTRVVHLFFHQLLKKIMINEMKDVYPLQRYYDQEKLVK